MSKPINVLITCVGGKFMYDFISCLRAVEGVRVIGADADSEAVGQLISDSFHIIPMASHDPDLFVESISDIIKTQNIDIFIPSADEEVAVTAEHYDHFKQLGVTVSFGNPQTVKDIADKFNLLKTLKTNDLYDGNFYLIQSEEDISEKLYALGYPDQKIIAKPRLGRGSRGVFLFDKTKKNYEPFLDYRFCGTGNESVFIKAMKERGLPINDIVLMPYYDGQFYDVDIVAKKGELQDICIRLRQLKNQFSPTSTGHKITMRPEVIDYAAKVCKAVNADGIFDMDIIQTPRIIVAIDAAFRFSGSVGASRTAGHNMPAQLVRSLRGEFITRMDVKDNTALRPFWVMHSIDEVKENIELSR